MAGKNKKKRNLAKRRARYSERKKEFNGKTKKN